MCILVVAVVVFLVSNAIKRHRIEPSTLVVYNCGRSDREVQPLGYQLRALRGRCQAVVIWSTARTPLHSRSRLDHPCLQERPSPPPPPATLQSTTHPCASTRAQHNHPSAQRECGERQSHLRHVAGQSHRLGERHGGVRALRRALLGLERLHRQGVADAERRAALLRQEHCRVGRDHRRRHPTGTHQQ